MYQLLILSNNSLQIHYYWAPRDSDNILDIHNYHSKGCLDYSTHSFYYFCFALLPQNQVSLFIHCTPEEGINIIVRIKATKRMREHHLLCFISFALFTLNVMFLIFSFWLELISIEFPAFVLYFISSFHAELNLPFCWSFAPCIKYFQIGWIFCIWYLR